MNKEDKNPVFEKIVEEYNKNVKDRLKNKNIDTGVEQIILEGWPDSIHYEFYDYKRVKKQSNEIGVEIHLEKDDVAYLFDILDENFDGMKILEGEYTLELDEKRSKKKGEHGKKGCWVVWFSDDISPGKIAAAMHELINKTKDRIDEEVKKFRSIQIFWNLAIKLEEEANKTGQEKNKIVEKALKAYFRK